MNLRCPASIYNYYPTTHPEHVDIDQQDAKDRRNILWPHIMEHGSSTIKEQHPQTPK